MVYIAENNAIGIEWTIQRGMTKEKEVFNQAKLVVFLVGCGDNNYYKKPLTYTKVNNVIKFQVPAMSRRGIYGVKAVWEKEEGKRMCSEKMDLFAITSSAEAEYTGSHTLIINTHAGSYGYDGLSSYEIACMYGKNPNSLTEEDWVSNVAELNSKYNSEVKVDYEEKKEYIEETLIPQTTAAKDLAIEKANLANTKATLANTKANLADEKATLAQQKADLADEKATLAAQKAALANTKANLADEKANIADSKATLAQQKADLAEEKANLAADKAALADQKAALADQKASAANQGAIRAEQAADGALMESNKVEQFLQQAQPVVYGASQVNASLNGTVLTVTDRNGMVVQKDVQGPAVPVIDNCTTDDGTKALSAKQGKLLAEGLANTVKVYEYDTLAETGQAVSGDEAFTLRYAGVISSHSLLEVICYFGTVRFDCYAHFLSSTDDDTLADFPYLGTVLFLDDDSNSWKAVASILPNNDMDGFEFTFASNSPVGDSQDVRGTFSTIFKNMAHDVPPMDGKTYGKKNGAWTEIEDSDGGEGSDTSTQAVEAGVIQVDAEHCTFNENSQHVSGSIAKKVADVASNVSQLEGNVGNLANLETSVKTDLVSAINEARQSGGGGGGGTTTIVDNLTSTSTTSALSANQGRVLKGLVDAKGTYTKPTNGIPKTDLASDVQTSLGKADTALQSHQSLSAYRKASAQDAIDATKATKIGVASAIPSGGMLPNTFYNLGELSGSVSLTMADATDNTIVNVWSFQFRAPSTAPSITWDAKITKWQGGNAPTINASKTYEVSVLNGIGLIVEV